MPPRRAESYDQHTMSHTMTNYSLSLFYDQLNNTPAKDTNKKTLLAIVVLATDNWTNGSGPLMNSTWMVLLFFLPKRCSRPMIKSVIEIWRWNQVKYQENSEREMQERNERKWKSNLKSQIEGQVSKWERNISELFIFDAQFPTNILSTICKLSVFTDI